MSHSVFILMSMVTNLPMGVFDTLDAAKKAGAESVRRYPFNKEEQEYAPYWYVLECEHNTFNYMTHSGAPYGKRVA